MESTEHPLHSIGKAFQSNPPGNSEPNHYTDLKINDQRLDCPENDQPPQASPAITECLGLTEIKAPALVIDHKLRVVWQNELSKREIWHDAHVSDDGNSAPLIFDFLFHPRFQNAVDNWRLWLFYYMRNLIDILPAETLRARIDRLEDNQKSVVGALVERLLSEPNSPALSSVRMRQSLCNGEIRMFRALSLDLNQGRLFAFEPVVIDENLGALWRSHDIEQRFEMIGRQPNPVKVPYSVLCARLNQSGSLRTELLSLEYCRLLSQICKHCIAVVERFGGVFGRHSDDGFSVYFLPADEYEADNSSNAIKCALELKAQAAQLSREWKLRKAWPNDIGLNFGIHRENEYAGVVSTSLGDNLTSFGNALNIAADLSRLARDGQILVTKALIDGMPPSDRNQLSFGIQEKEPHRHPALRQNSFSRVQDLPGMIDLSGGIYDGIGSVVVTQLFGFKAARKN